MATYKVSRLSIFLDGATGHIQRLRTRPSGFRLSLSEADSYFDLPEVASSYQVGTTVDVLHTSAIGTLAPRELLVISTDWSNTHQKVTRTFRTLKLALLQRVEIFEFDYQLKTDRPTSTVLLRFESFVWHELQENGFQVQTIQYRFLAKVATTGNVQWWIETSPVSNEATLNVKVDGDGRLVVSLVVGSEEKSAQDSVIHLIPAPLDEFTYLATALAPRVREMPLSFEPRLKVVIPSAPILYRIPESLIRDAGPQNILKKLRNWLFRRNRSSIALPPRNYPLGDMVRTSDILIYHWQPQITELLEPIIEFLRGLGEDRLASLQRILVVSEDDGGAQYFNGLKSRVGQILLPRVQPATPQECSLDQRIISHDLSNLEQAISTLDAEFELLRWEPPHDSREAFRRAFPVKPLSPVPIPATGKPDESAPFLVAARLRGSTRLFDEHGSHQESWPLPLQSRKHEARSVEVAQFVLTDLATHQILRDAGGGQSYEKTWLGQYERLRKGEARADRVTLVSISGDTPETDRMKLLPAVLYSTQEPAPILSFRMSKKQQRSILAKFNNYALHGHEACLSVAKRDGTSPGQRFYDQLDEKRQALQDEFRKVLPAEYVDFLRQVRPKEIINFSSLPLDWLEIDETGLGYLTKITTLRSTRPNADLGFCADLCATYNSLVASEIRVSRNESRVLIIAPQYHSANQAKVNAFIQSSVAGLERRIKEQQSVGREVNYRTINDPNLKELTELLSEEWALIVFVGHAGNGVLTLSDGQDVAPTDLPEKALRDTTILLIGCDTQGAANLSGSVASQFLNLGARGVFSTYFPIALGPLADNMFLNLMVYIMELNHTYGDVLALTRFSMLWEHWPLFYAQELGLAVRPEVTWVSNADADYLKYRGEWDKFYQESLGFYGNLSEAQLPGPNVPVEIAAMIGRRAQIPGLAISFTGDIDARLFDF